VQSKRDRVYFFLTRLADLMRQGMPLFESIQLTRDELNEPVWRDEISAIELGLECGSVFYELLGEDLSPAVQEILKVGFENGTLDPACKEAAELLQSSVS